MTIRTGQGESGTETILAIFRANGLLLSAGDELAADVGLTAARWQVLGALALATEPLTVPQVARRMGLARQSVHATVKHLLGDGLVELVPNTDHQRSQLVCLTRKGLSKFQAIDQLQAAWVNQLVVGLTRSELKVTARVLGELCARLEAARNEEGDKG